MTTEAGARRRLSLAAQLGPGFLYYVVFFLAPILLLFAFSFYAKENFQFVADLNVDNYLTVIQSDTFRRLIIRTFVVATVVGALTVVLAFPFVYIVTFAYRRRRALFLFLVLVSLFGGYIVRIYAWRTILGAEGVINGSLVAAGLIDDPIRWLLNSPFAVTVALVNFFLPIAVLPITASMENVSPSLLRAAHDLGANRLRAMSTIVLPLTVPGVKAAFAFVFIGAAADFATPALLGGAKAAMVGSTVAQLFGRSLDWPLGAALAFTLMALVLGALLLAHLALRKVFP